MCVCFVLYTKIFFSDNFAKKHKLVFPGVYKMSTETEPQKVPEEDEMEEEFSESESENEEIESTVDENEIGDEIDISDEDYSLKCDLDMKTMLEVLNVSTGLNSATLDKFPNRILTKTYDAGFKMSLMNKDVALYINEARNNNVSTNIAEVVNNYFQKGQKSIPSVILQRYLKLLVKRNFKLKK